jgi:5-methylcytosine-specific restriction endonuclease McrA
MLQDPRWIARREEIMIRGEYRCAECGTEDQGWNRLQVHHRHYRSGAAPWEYEDADLVCLCADCHELITDEIERAHRVIGKLRIDALPKIVAYANTLLAQDWPLRLPAMALNDECEEV